MSDHTIGKGYVEIGAKLNKLDADLKAAKAKTKAALDKISKSATITITGAMSGSGAGVGEKIVEDIKRKMGAGGIGFPVKILARDILNLESEKAAIQMKAAQHLERIRLQEELKDIRKAERDKVNAPKIAEAAAIKTEQLQRKEAAAQTQVEEKLAGKREAQEAKQIATYEKKMEAVRRREEAAKFRSQEKLLKAEELATGLFEKREERLTAKKEEANRKQLQRDVEVIVAQRTGDSSGSGDLAQGLLRGMGASATKTGIIAAIGKVATFEFQQASSLNEAYLNLAMTAGRTGQKFKPLKEEVEKAGDEIAGLTALTTQQAVSMGSTAAMLRGLGIPAGDLMRTAIGLTQWGGSEKDPEKAMQALVNVAQGGNLDMFKVPIPQGLFAGERLKHAINMGKVGYEALALRGGLTQEEYPGRMWADIKSEMQERGVFGAGADARGGGLFGSQQELWDATAATAGQVSKRPALPYNQANPLLFPPDETITPSSPQEVGGNDWRAAIDQLIKSLRDSAKQTFRLNETIERSN